MAFGDPSPPADDKKGSAKGILTQIKGLLHQYIDLGDSTPLKGEADSFLNQVEDGLDQLDSDSASESPAEDKSEGGEGAESAGYPHGSSKPGDFRSATKAAKAAGLMSRHGSHEPQDDGTKTDSEQSQEDDPKKKKSKAGFPF